VVKEIRCAIHEHYSAVERIRIVLESLRGEYSIAGLCRRESSNYPRPFRTEVQADTV
jgi:transposase